MIRTEKYIKGFNEAFNVSEDILPWEFVQRLPQLLHEMIASLGDQYTIGNDIAIHKTARIDATAIIHGPAIISENVYVGCFALLRNSVYIGKNSIVGAHGEIKNSVLMNHSCCGHFNFVGESIIGNNVNLEAGAVLANHYNELKDQPVIMKVNGQKINTGCIKLGSVIGDGSRIGANAVLYPGILLPKNTVVERLQLVKEW